MPVYDSADIKDPRYLFSQTPPNFVEKNYYLNTLQMKVDADWPFRPNRKIVEQEGDPGTELYSPIEVVVQTVKNEKGEAVSDDWYKLVFKDCGRQNRLGKRFRFSYEFDPDEEDSKKNIWIGLNQTTLSPTSSQVVCRCNGTLGSIWTDENGNNSYHFEPIIQPSTLSSPGVDFSNVAVDPKGSMMMIAQYNKYTQQYYINQRFVIGHDFVYKISNIIKSDSRTTYETDDVGIMRIYMEIDQVGPKDDMVNRIAYNGIKEEPSPQKEEGELVFAIAEPAQLPESLTSLTFKPQLTLGEVPISSPITVDFTLVGTYADKAQKEKFVSLVDNGDGTWTATKLKTDLTLRASFECSTTYQDAPYTLNFSLSLV